MDIEQIIILVVIIVAIYSYSYFNNKVKMKQLESKLNEAETIKLFDEVQAIKHRLEALEKIVTDKGLEVKEEIDKLK